MKKFGLAVLAVFLISFFASATLPPETFYAANIAYRGYYDDGAWGPFNIGFNFTYFGNVYSQFYVSSNGMVTFGGWPVPGSPNWSPYSNTAIPNAATPNNTIYAFWDDITIDTNSGTNPGANGGTIYYQMIGTAPHRRCVIQFTNMAFWNDPTLLGTFSVILYETTNVIQIQYRIIVDTRAARAHGNSATVGIENAAGSAAVQYEFNTANTVRSELALKFTPNGGSYDLDAAAIYEGVLLGDAFPPTIPTLLSPADNATVPLTPTFQWTPCDNTTSYLFKYSTASTLLGSTDVNVGLATTYTPAVPFPAGATYYWAVFARGTGTTWSEIHRFTTSTIPPPTANPQTVWTTLGADTAIQLSGTGGNGALTAKVTALPLHGELYQYGAGARGARITAVPADVSDGLMRVIFTINDGQIGTGRGNFQFTVRDAAAWESSAATVTVNVYPAPTVATLALTGKTATGVTTGGDVTADGGSPVTSRGVCWGTSAAPTIAGSHTTDGSGLGTYSSVVSGLTTGTTYYLRAYAVNSSGTGYGNTLVYQPGMPEVATADLTLISGNGATGGGTVVSDGGASVTARGVCWAQTVNPTTAGAHTTDGSGTGAFVSSINGLTPSTTYHLRAYALNSTGTAYGDDKVFTTSEIVTTPPVVTTTAASVLTATTAASGGEVVSDGGSPVTARGVCWALTAGPTTAALHTTDGSGPGLFTSALTGLAPNTLYHYRAYATNLIGTSYGSDLTFTSAAAAATVTTTAASVLTATTAASGGEVVSDGGSPVTARGVCWALTAGPTTTASHTTDGSGPGLFTSALTGLAPNTLYHYRAYATNGAGTSYGGDLTFTTAANPVVSGRVTGSGSGGLSGVTISFSGSGGSTATDDAGYYSQIVPYGWSGTATPHKSGYGFSPAQRTYENLTAGSAEQDYTVQDSVPTVIIVTPSAGADLAGLVSVSAQAQDADGISRLEIYIDGTLKTSSNGGTAAYDWDTRSAAFGEHTIQAVAFDGFGLRSSVEIGVHVDNPPTVHIANPAGASRLKGVIRVDVSAADDQGIERIELFIDDVLDKTAYGPALSVDWNTTRAAFGSHVLRARAYDLAGRLAEEYVRVTVDNPPAIEIFEPAAGASVYGAVNVRARASDDDRVVKVEFSVDGTAVAATGTQESQGRRALRSSVPGGFLQARFLDTAGALSASSASSPSKETSAAAGSALYFLDGRKRLWSIGAAGRLAPVFPDDRPVRSLQQAAGGALYIVFAEPRDTGGNGAAEIAVLDPADGSICGLGGSDIRVRTDFRHSPAVQSGSDEAVFFIAEDGAGNVLRRKAAGSDPIDLFYWDIPVAEWHVNRDGSVLLAGESPDGSGMRLVKINPAGGSTALASGLSGVAWIAELPDGKAYLSLAAAADEGKGSGIFRISGNDTLVPTFVPGPDGEGPKAATGLFPASIPLDGEAGTMDAVACSASGMVLAIARDARGGSRLVQILPEVRIVSSAFLTRPEIVRAYGAGFLAAGGSPSGSRLVLIDPRSGCETDLTPAGLSVLSFASAGNGDIYVSGFRSANRTQVIGRLRPGFAAGDSEGSSPVFMQADWAELKDRPTCLTAVGVAAAGSAADVRSGVSTAAASMAGRGTAAAADSSGDDSEYAFPWETLDVSNGLHSLKATATDSGGQTTSHEISVRVANLQIDLGAARRTAKAWMIQRPYGELSVSISNPGGLGVVGYKIYRRDGSGPFKVIAEIPVSSVSGGAFTYQDKYLENGLTYSYRIVAFDGTGAACGRSADKTI